MALGFILARARPYRGRLVLVSALTLASSMFLLAVPWLAGKVIGGVIGAGAAQPDTAVVLLAGALAASTALGIAAGLLSAATSARILADLREDVHAHVQALPVGFHDHGNQAELLGLMAWEVNNLSSFIAGTLARLPANIVTAAGAGLFLFLIDPALGLFLPLLLPVGFVVMKWLGRRMRRLSHDARLADAELVNQAQQNLFMLPVTKSFAVEEVQQQAFAERVEKARRLHLAQQGLSIAVGPLVALVAAWAAIAVLLVSGERLAGEERTAPELFSFLLYAALLTRPVGALADVYGRVQWARGTLARLGGVLAEPVEPGLSHGASLPSIAGEIAFQGVGFAYPGRPPVLQDVSFRVRAGEVIALTGENGQGKSTLISLLLRFHDPDRGRILLDGHDIAGLRVQDYRRQIGYVPQQALLFDGTIRDNIAFGHASASDDAIGAAADLAQARDFIAAMPDGLDTRIGDHGVRLSGGQRQRIALARALLGQPQVLLLDEATSMYDLEGEAAFVTACQTALRGRTVIIVTHRPASLALADRIMRVSAGTVCEIA